MSGERAESDIVHVLTEYGTTTCPVEAVRANVDDGECSACGARVFSPRKCSCGSDATSLNPAEVVVHRTDGPCTIEPTS